MSFFKNGSQFRHLWHPEHFRSLPPRLGEVCGRPLSPQVSSSQNLQWLRRGAGGGIMTLHTFILYAWLA